MHDNGDYVIPITQPYYDRMTTEAAIQMAREMIAEWSYADDPHGYCHVRPMLMLLLEYTKGER